MDLYPPLHPPSTSAQHPDAAATGGGLLRWFPNGFATEGIDWLAFEEHLSMVPDLAFEVVIVAAPSPVSDANTDQTTTSVDTMDPSRPHNPPSLSSGGDNVMGDQEESPNNTSLFRGVHALHLAVSCGRPPAPLSVVQRLVDINPDALDKTEETSGMNVLHCALRFHPHLQDALDDNNPQNGDDNISTDEQSIASTPPSRDCHLAIDETIKVTQLLLRAKVDLARQLSTPLVATTMAAGQSSGGEEVVGGAGGLPPLAYAPCKEAVPLLVKAMPLSMVTSVLDKIFQQRRLLTSATNVESMEQVVREVWVVELQQERSILSSGMLPPKVSRKQSIIEYTLYQALLTPKGTPERFDLFRLAQVVLQATYSFHFHNNNNNSGVDERTLFTSTPPAWDCLEDLVGKHKIKKKTLELYQQLQQEDNISTAEQEEPTDSFSQGAFNVDPSSVVNYNHNNGSSHEGFIQEEKKQDNDYHQGQQERYRHRYNQDDSGIEEVLVAEGENVHFRRGPSSGSMANAAMDELLRRKEQLNAKIEQSFDAVRRAASALERYQAMYDRTVAQLQLQMDPSSPTVSPVPEPSIYFDTTPTSSGSRKRQPSEQSVLHSAANQSHKRADNKEENSSSVRAFVALSSLECIPAPLPSIPRAASMPMASSVSAAAPQRRLSSSSSGHFPSTNTTRNRRGENNSAALEKTIQDTMEEVTAACHLVGRINSIIVEEADVLERQHENRTKFCMSFFRTAEQGEAAEAIDEIRSCLAQTETLKHRIKAVKEDLKEAKSHGDNNNDSVAQRQEQDTTLALLNSSLLTLEGKIGQKRVIVTRRRHELGNRMFEARKFMKGAAQHRDRRTRRLMRKSVQNFLTEAKKEMKGLLAHLRDIPGPNKDRKDRQRLRRKSKHMSKEEQSEEELTQMTKRLKLK